MHHKNVELLALTLFCIGLTGMQAQTLKDIEGNVYSTVSIGTQVWMAENLKTTKYSNGDSIGTTYPATLDITSENAPKYQWAFDGNESNVAIYGRLYTWYTVIDSRNICPAGWHVPTDAEWTILTDYLTNNGYCYKGNRGEISKSMAATSGWTTNYIEGNVGNDQMSNNKSGFSAFAGGYRYGNGSFNGFGSFGYWWSATEVYLATALYRNLCYYGNDVYGDSSSKQNGISIRCIKNKKSTILR
jgi:uncharacterized protein (TIGR02145 family)